MLAIFGFSIYIDLYNVSSAVFVRFHLCGMLYNHNVIDQPYNLSSIYYIQGEFRIIIIIIIITTLKRSGMLVKLGGDFFYQFDRYTSHSNPSILSDISHCM